MQLVNSLPSTLANSPASSGVRSFHSLPHYLWLVRSAPFAKSPCPTPALEATRWHYLPTVGAATSLPPALPVLPPKGASLIIPNRQLSGRASGNADNYFLIIARDNNNYRHCLRAALGYHIRSVSPCPTPALEATRWHFLPTVEAATSLSPALPVLPPKGASQIIPNRRISAATCAPSCL